MVLGTTHKRHMIPAPPAVSSVPNTDAPQSRHHILRQQHDAPLSSTALSLAVLSTTIVPPVVPPLYPKYGVIHKLLKATVDRAFLFSPSLRLQMPGSAGCPGSNGMEKNAAFIVRLKCAHVYSAIFSSLSQPFTTVPYLTIFPPPLLPLIQCGALIVGANPIAFMGSGIFPSSEGNSFFRFFLPSL
ncbi:hypothetical protein XELAEV_18029707mg [Xenopus laevis]|uniref:Uncharacterized protein n=1 Tax=Xenopus laevis TaxID=8355 RepID=A0A974HHW6_XENLA|nr:hypothetical protein XELAEV_18029707mg [Xenopus laevis]